MQVVQNFAGRIVLGLRKYNHISEGLKSLRWLPIADKLLSAEMVEHQGTLVKHLLVDNKLITIEIHDTKKTSIYRDAD